MLFRNLKTLNPLKNFVRFHSKDQKTMALFLNEIQGAPLMINALSKTGFRLNNGFATIGPTIVFPRTVLSWLVTSVEDINEKSLSLFLVLEPKTDIIVIGVGDPGKKIDDNTQRFMRYKGFSLEVLPTERACQIYNFLVNEGRFVAAALIPPLEFKVPKLEETIDLNHPKYLENV